MPVLSFPCRDIHCVIDQANTTFLRILKKSNKQLYIYVQVNILEAGLYIGCERYVTDLTFSCLLQSIGIAFP